MNSLLQLFMQVTRWSTSVINVGVAHVGMCIKAFKRRAGLGYNKWFWVINNTVLFKTVIPLRI